MMVNEKMIEFYKDDVNNINKFLSSRPSAVGVYCYGIGNYLGKKIYKLILVTEDIWKWQADNEHSNEFTQYCNLLYQEGFNFIEYTGIKENRCIFDYTLMSGSAFIESLIYWKIFSYAEIFQKPFITIKSNEDLDNIIKNNQRKALITSLLMINDNKTSFFDLMLKIYCISDTISNEKLTLIDNNYEFLKAMYGNSKYFTLSENDQVFIDREKIINDIVYLPSAIKHKINITDNGICTTYIQKYLSDKRQIEQEDITSMRILVNGFFKNMLSEERQNKIKIWKCN